MGLSGTDVAVETADIALAGDRVEQVAAVIELGRRTLNILRFGLDHPRPGTTEATGQVSHGALGKAFTKRGWWCNWRRNAAGVTWNGSLTHSLLALFTYAD